MSDISRRTALMAPALIAAPALAQASQMAIATGTTGGVYYPLAERWPTT